MRHPRSLSCALAASLLLGAAAASAAPPVLSPEIPLSAPSFGPPPGNQQGAAVASDGSTYLVVWADDRSQADTSYDIRGARVLADGTVLDPLNLLLQQGPAVEDSPAIAFGGGVYLVVWSAYPSGSFDARDIFGARVTTDGQVLDPGGFAISAAPSVEELPSVTFDGQSFLVAWHARGDVVSLGVHAARVSLDGIVLDPAGIEITPDHAYGRPALAPNGTSTLVVWNDTRNDAYADHTDLYAARVDMEGNVLDPGGIQIAGGYGDQLLPAAAFDGANTLVAWSDNKNAVIDVGQLDIYARRVSPAGSVIDAVAWPIAVGPGFRRRPVAIRDGSEVVLLWQQSSDPIGDTWSAGAARLSQAGAVLPPGTVTAGAGTSHETGSFGAAAAGAGFLAVSSKPITGPGVHGRMIPPSLSGAPTEPIRIASALAQQTRPSAASDGSSYLVSWIEQREESRSAPRVARVTADGAVLDPEGIPVTESPTSSWADSVQAVFVDADYLLVWKELWGPSGVQSALRVARVAPDGTVLDPVPTTIDLGLPLDVQPYHAYEFAVSTDGERVLVITCGAVHDAGGNPQGSSVRAIFLRPDGAVESPVQEISQRPCATPMVTFDGEHFVAAWATSFAARLTPGGALLDPDGIPLPGTSMSIGPFDAGSLFVLRDGMTSSLLAARLGHDGQIQGAEHVIAGPADADHEYIGGSPTIFNGHRAVVTWFAAPSLYQVYPSSDVHVSAITPDGEVEAAGPFAGSNPSLAAGSGGDALLVYRVVDEGVSRVRFRRVSDPEAAAAGAGGAGGGGAGGSGGGVGAGGAGAGGAGGRAMTDGPSGCGCEVAGATAAQGAWWILLAGAALAGARRRRDRR